jgi:hypothetical protein
MTIPGLPPGTNAGDGADGFKVFKTLGIKVHRGSKVGTIHLRYRFTFGFCLLFYAAVFLRCEEKFWFLIHHTAVYHAVSAM